MIKPKNIKIFFYTFNFEEEGNKEQLRRKSQF